MKNIHWQSFPAIVHSRITHWGRVTHICIRKLTSIGSDKGLSPGRRQAIIWTNAGILLIGPLGTNFSEILIKIHTFSFKKMHLKMLSGKWRPFCLGLNVLTQYCTQHCNNNDRAFSKLLTCPKDYTICIHISYHILDFTEDQIHNEATLHVACPILSIPCLLMPWRLKEPGHQQTWYCPNKPEYSIFSIRRVN